ncbi:hypothetical protein AK812_SmicGene46179, partial [Symbiodinium microadriaticum]
GVKAEMMLSMSALVLRFAYNQGIVCAYAEQV